MLTLARIRLWALGLGPLGLGLLALLDSSVLSFPQVVDALVLVLSARHPASMPAYVGLSALGSTLGCFALYLVGRHGGTLFLRRRFGAARVERAGAIYERWGVAAVMLAAIAPPPVPLKLFVLLAGAAGMHPAVFAASVGGARGARYLAEGVLAVMYGDHATAIVAAHGVEIAIGVAVAALVILGGWIVLRRVRPAPDDPGAEVDSQPAR